MEVLIRVSCTLWTSLEVLTPPPQNLPLPATFGKLQVPDADAVQIIDAITCLLIAPGRLQAHSGIIYDLTWTADSKVLVSCSSDCTAKVWYLDAASNTQRNHSPFTTTQQANLPFCTVLHHSSYVYSCEMNPKSSLERTASSRHAECEKCGPGGALLLVTGCADGMLYCWALNADMDPNLAPDGAEPLLRKPSRSHLQLDSKTVRVNALLWDEYSPAKLYGRIRKPNSNCGSDPSSPHAAAELQHHVRSACVSERDSSQPFGLTDAASTQRTHSSRNPSRRASGSSSSQQSSSMLFSGKLYMLAL